MTIAEALSIRLKELLDERQMTQYRLFKLTGVNPTTIGDILKKRNKCVNLRILVEICQGLEIELVTFFDSPIFKMENIID